MGEAEEVEWVKDKFEVNDEDEAARMSAKAVLKQAVVLWQLQLPWVIDGDVGGAWRRLVGDGEDRGMGLVQVGRSGWVEEGGNVIQMVVVGERHMLLVVGVLLLVLGRLAGLVSAFVLGSRLVAESRILMVGSLVTAADP